MRVNTRQLPVDSAAPARLITRLDRALSCQAAGPLGQPRLSKKASARTRYS